MNKKKNILHPFFFAIALICANGGIIISILHLVFHFIDSVNFAVAFLDSMFTEVIMLIASIMSLLTTIFVLYILQKNKSKSYFFRKISFISFWISAINIMFQRNVIYPNMLEDYQRNAIWFLVSVFTLLNSIFCDGLLSMTICEIEESEENVSEDFSQKEKISD